MASGRFIHFSLHPVTLSSSASFIELTKFCKYVCIYWFLTYYLLSPLDCKIYEGRGHIGFTNQFALQYLLVTPQFFFIRHLYFFLHKFPVYILIFLLLLFKKNKFPTCSNNILCVKHLFRVSNLEKSISTQNSDIFSFNSFIFKLFYL